MRWNGMRMARYRLSRSVKITLVSIFGIYLVSFGIFFPWMCARLPYSKYFISDPSAVDVVKEIYDANKLRHAHASSYLNSLDITQLKNKDSYKKVDLAVGIITINRNSEDVGALGYLTQTLASVLRAFEEKALGFETKKLFICNVDRYPSLHTEAEQLSAFADVISRGENGVIATNIFEKEKDDYVYCLEHAAQYNPRYILLLEDDVFLEENFFVILGHLLRSRVVQARAHTDEVIPGKDWLFVKAYYPFKWSGYSNEIDKIGELLGMALIGGMLFSSISLSLASINRSFLLTLVLFLAGAIFAVVSAHTVGRPYVQLWRKYFVSTHRLVAAAGCCTQAVFFPANVIPDLRRHLQSIQCTKSFSIDQAMDEFGDMWDLQRYLIEPNLCSHIGFISTVRANAKLAAEFLN